MADSNYSKAYDEVYKYHQRLVDNVTKEILAAVDRDGSPDFKLDAILEEYSRKLCDVCTVAGELATAKNRGQLAEVLKRTDLPKPPRKEPLRVATIHCSADRVTETLNKWFANHTNVEPVSVMFAHLDRGHACIVIYRLSSESPRQDDSDSHL